MGRKSNTEQRRQQIIDALRVELSEVGYECASIKSIADRAGLAPGLVHYHFHNKEEVLLVLLEQLITQADQRYRLALESAPRAVDRLRAYIRARLGYGAQAQEQQVQAWVSIIAQVVGQQSVRDRLSRWLSTDHRELSGLLAEAGASAPDSHASQLLAMVLGAFSLHAIGVEGVSKGYAADEALAWLERLLPATKGEETF